MELKKVQSELEKVQNNSTGNSNETAQQIAEMHKTISVLTEGINTLKVTREREVLIKEYPDILPELLLGKTEEEQKSLAENSEL